MIIKAGDLSSFITSFIGVMRDDYINFLTHELRGTFFNATTKILEDLFVDYPTYEKINENNIHLITMLSGYVNATDEVVAYGVDGSFYHLDIAKKNSGLKIKQPDQGITLEDTIDHYTNDSSFDFMLYFSDYSIDTLIDALAKSGSLKNQNYKIKRGDLKFVEGL